MLVIKSIGYAFYLGLVMIIGFYAFAPSNHFEAQANDKTMDDAGPTNPVSTNRFPRTYSQPIGTPTPQGVIINSDKSLPSGTPKPL